MEAMIQLNSMTEVKDFVRYASAHKGDITLYSDRYTVDGKSIMGVFSLDLSKPVKMIVEGVLPIDVREGIHQFVVEG